MDDALRQCPVVDKGVIREDIKSWLFNGHRTVIPNKDQSTLADWKQFVNSDVIEEDDKMNYDNFANISTNKDVIIVHGDRPNHPSDCILVSPPPLVYIANYIAQGVLIARIGIRLTLPEDRNALFARLGIFSSKPPPVDEISTLKRMDRIMIIVKDSDSAQETRTNILKVKKKRNLKKTIFLGFPSIKNLDASRQQYPTNTERYYCCCFT